MLSEEKPQQNRFDLQYDVDLLIPLVPPASNQASDQNDQSMYTNGNLCNQWPDDEPPVANQNVHSTFSNGRQYNQCPGDNQFPPPGGAQYPGNQYQLLNNARDQVITLEVATSGTVPMDVNRAPKAQKLMILALLSCLCCFWPTGLCAIIAATKANSAVKYGDAREAEAQAGRARTFMIISIIIGVICVVLYASRWLVELKEIHRRE